MSQIHLKKTFKNITLKIIKLDLDLYSVPVLHTHTHTQQTYNVKNQLYLDLYKSCLEIEEQNTRNSN